MHHDLRAADPVDRRVDALRRELDHAFAFERLAGLVEHDHVARARLRPVEAEWQDEVPIRGARNGDGEVVVDTFFERVQYREAGCRGELNLGLPDRVGARGYQRMDGHAAMIIEPGMQVAG